MLQKNKKWRKLSTTKVVKVKIKKLYYIIITEATIKKNIFRWNFENRKRYNNERKKFKKAYKSRTKLNQIFFCKSKI